MVGDECCHACGWYAPEWDIALECCKCHRLICSYCVINLKGEHQPDSLKDYGVDKKLPHIHCPFCNGGMIDNDGFVEYIKTYKTKEYEEFLIEFRMHEALRP